MASNGKHLETNYRLGIVVLDGLHVFQGPEWCQKSNWTEQQPRQNQFTK